MLSKVDTVELRNVESLGRDGLWRAEIHGLSCAGSLWQVIGYAEISGAILPPEMDLPPARVKYFTLMIDGNPKTIKCDLVVGHNWTVNYIKTRYNDLVAWHKIVIEDDEKEQELSQPSVDYVTSAKVHANQLMNCFDNMTVNEIKEKIKIIAGHLNED